MKKYISIIALFAVVTACSDDTPPKSERCTSASPVVLEPSEAGCVAVNIDNASYSSSDESKVRACVDADDENQLNVKILDAGLCVELRGTHAGQVRLKNGGNYATTVVLDGIGIGPAASGNSGLRLNAGDITGLDASEPYNGFVYTVRLKGDSTIVGASDYNGKKAVNCKGNMTVTGDGTLRVEGHFKTGIHVDDVLRIESGTVDVVLDRASATLSDPEDGSTQQKGFGVKAGNGFEMAGGTLRITATDSATQATGYEARGLKVAGMDYKNGDGKGYIRITGGSIDITSDSKALFAGWEAEDAECASVCAASYKDYDYSSASACTSAACGGNPAPLVEIAGGDIRIATKLAASGGNGPGGGGNPGGGPGGRPGGGGNPGGMPGADQSGSASRSPEGIESKGSLTITGGNIYIKATDDGINSAGDMTIGASDGTGPVIVSQSTGNDGIDANGNMTFLGGIVAGIGAGSPECGIDVNTEGQKSIAFKGGTVIGIGASAGDYPKTWGAGAAVSGSVTKGKTVALADASGNAIAAIRVPSDAGGTGMYILSDRLTSGQSYRLYTDADVTNATWFADTLLTAGASVSGTATSVTAAQTTSQGGMMH